MKLAVISDIHLGRGDRSDQFGHDDADFLRFLDFLEGDFERIVLLGDVYETLASPVPMAQVEELAAIRAAHPEVTARFDRPQYTYLHGNHDLVTRHVGGAPTELRLEVDGKRLLFTHGHGYDVINRRAPWLAEWSVWLASWVSRVGMAGVYRFFDHVDRFLRGLHIDPRKATFEDWALALGVRCEADVVVTGHTHEARSDERGGRLFMNSGTCAEGRFEFLTLDTVGDHYALHTSW